MDDMMVICRLCEKKVEAPSMDEHLINCQELFETRKSLNQIQGSIQKISENVRARIRTLTTQMTLLKAKQMRIVSPNLRRASNQLDQDFCLEDELVEDDKRESNRSLDSSKLVTQKGKSKFSLLAQTLQSSDDSSDSQVEIQIVKATSTGSQEIEQQLEELYAEQIKKTEKLGRRVTSPQFQLQCQIRSLGSPISSDGDNGEQLRGVKKVLNVLKLIEKYCCDISKYGNQMPIKIDIQTQLELSHFQAKAKDIKDLVSETLTLSQVIIYPIKQRVGQIQKLNKLLKTEEDTIHDQYIMKVDQSQGELHHSHQAKQSPTIMKNSGTLKNSGNLRNSGNMRNSTKTKKSDNMKRSGNQSWLSKPSTLTEFGQMLPSPPKMKTNTFTNFSRQADMKQCESGSDELIGKQVDSEEEAGSGDNSSSIQSDVSITEKRVSNGINSFQQLQQISSESDSCSGSDYEKGYYSDGAIAEKKYKIKDPQLLNVSLQDFEFVEVLGVGAFGAVWLVQKKQTKDLYAMKVIDCRSKSIEEVQGLRAEKNVFEILEGDFVVKAYYSFVQDKCLFFLLELMKGGDFSQVLQYYCALDESVAKFYISELLLAIESLHKKGIIHRDLKPQNILLDQHGHVKLADFGLSEIALKQKVKQVAINETNQSYYDLPETLSKIHITTQTHIDYKEQETKKKTNAKKEAHRIVGTPDYIPPEVIQGESINNFTIDWWSFGVIIYELLVGVPPFNDASIPEIFDNILALRIEWPEIGFNDDQISQNAYNLINSLLNPDYHNRLGSNGAQEIKKHPFFKGVNWDNIRRQEPPIMPIRDFKIPEGEHRDIKKKSNEIKKMQNLLSKVQQSQEYGNLSDIANLTRFDLLAKLSKQDAENKIRRHSICPNR